MGEPLRIEELARSLMGATPVAIRYTGLRPGDKLREDLLFANEVKEGVSGPLTVIRTPAPEPVALHAAMARFQAAGTLEEMLPEIRALVCQ
jgi:FlaA1/EpsC-like NDP-sugar epimerase